jgi:hypothetical protein
MQMPGQHAQGAFQLAAAYPLLKTAMARLKRRVFSRQFAPLGAGTEYPKDAVEHGPGVVPWPAAMVISASRTKRRLDHPPLFVG